MEVEVSVEIEMPSSASIKVGAVAIESDSADRRTAKAAPDWEVELPPNQSKRGLIGVRFLLS